jgi:hypothetical protein
MSSCGTILLYGSYSGINHLDLRIVEDILKTAFAQQKKEGDRTPLTLLKVLTAYKASLKKFKVLVKIVALTLL